MAIIKPGYQIISADESIVTFNEIHVGEEVSTRDAFIISRWLQRFMPEMLRAFKQIEEEQ
jgi:hypothetical protein